MNEMKKAFEQALAEDWKKHKMQTKLHGAVEYALQSGGKRFRPLIVLSVAESLDAMPAALCVEYFHTASLIADDLPCMDDDDLRRGKPSLHRAFNETTALLASYALICAGFEKIHTNTEILARSSGAELAAKAGMLALDQASKAAGIEGATGGQFLDLFPPSSDLDTLLEILRLKTVTLFETAFVLGWIFGGKDVEALPVLRRAAAHFGMAFQIGDDLIDLRQDRPGGANIAIELGAEKASRLFDEQMQGFDECLKCLGLESSGLAALRNLLVSYLAPATSV